MLLVLGGCPFLDKGKLKACILSLCRPFNRGLEQATSHPSRYGKLSHGYSDATQKGVLSQKGDSSATGSGSLWDPH